MAQFEPEVLESIKHSRRKLFLEGLLIMVVLFVVVSAIVFLLVSSFQRNEWIAAVILSGLAIAIGALFILSLRSSYERFVTPADGYNDVSRDDFRDALENVSIGAGIETPHLRVLDIPTVNSVAFTYRGKPFVGLTAEAVERETSKVEAEAMMAHEVAHIVMGDTLKPLDLWHLRTFPFILICVVAFLAAWGIASAMESGAREDTVIFVVSFIFIIWAWTIATFIVHRLDVARRHDDVLADSIAVKITSNPEGLEQAISDLDDLIDEADRLPPDNYCSRHLFICPHNPWKRRGKEEPLRDQLYEHSLSREDLDSLHKRDRIAIFKRLENLEAIEQGHWPAFPEG